MAQVSLSVSENQIGLKSKTDYTIQYTLLQTKERHVMMLQFSDIPISNVKFEIYCF